MAFMAMRKNLDERARQKELDAIFAKFDHNHNGSSNYSHLNGVNILRFYFFTKEESTSKTFWPS